MKDPMHRRPWRGSDKAQTTKAVPHILKITKPKGFRVEFRLEPSNGESQGLRHHPTLSTSRGPAAKRTLRNEYGFSFLHSVALKCLFFAEPERFLPSFLMGTLVCWNADSFGSNFGHPHKKDDLDPEG